MIHRERLNYRLVFQFSCFFNHQSDATSANVINEYAYKIFKYIKCGYKSIWHKVNA